MSRPAADGIPVPFGDQVDQRERRDRELRDDQQRAGGVDPQQVSCRGRASRPWRVGRDGRARRISRNARREHADTRTAAGKQQRLVRAECAQRRQGQSGDRHTERLRGLPDAHCQAPLSAGKPPHDHPPARRVDRPGAGTGQAEQQHKQDPEPCHPARDQQEDDRGRRHRSR